VRGDESAIIDHPCFVTGKANRAHNGGFLCLAEMGIGVRRKLGATEGLKGTCFDRDLLVGRRVVAVVAGMVQGSLLHDGAFVSHGWQILEGEQRRRGMEKGEGRREKDERRKEKGEMICIGEAETRLLGSFCS